MGLFDQWNKNRFSIYKNEEKTVLKLLESMSKWFDVITKKVDEVDTLSNDNQKKKVSYEDLHTKYQLTTDGKSANFDGTWQGLKKPTLSVEGAHSQVEKNMEDIKILNQEVAQNKVIFMPIGETVNAAGDCSCIITKNKKVILIDTGAAESYSLINYNLKKNCVSKIDYLIITHYHADHCQNLAQLQNDFDMTNTIYYLQKHSEKYQYMDSEVIRLVGANEKIYPNTSDKVTIDTVDLTFINCSQTDIDYYDVNTNNYNDYSMCCYCEIEGTRILFTGDINLKAQSRINEQGLFKKVDVLKVEHHAFDTTVNHDYIRKVNPTYAVVSEAEKSLSTKNTVISETLSLLNGIGAKVVMTGKEVVTFNFNEKGKEFLYKYTIGGNFKDVGNYTFIYLDSSYQGFSDGTYHNPFRTIREAMAEAYKYNRLNVQFIPKQTTFTSDEHLRVANFHGTLKLDKIAIRGLDIRNSNIVIGTLEVTGTHSKAFVIESSNVEFTSLTLKGDTRSAVNEYEGRGLCIYKSKVWGKDLTLSNKRIALCCYNNSDVFIENIQGENNEFGFICTNGSKMLNTKVTMEYQYPFKDLQKTSIIDGGLKNDLTKRLEEGEDLNNFTTPRTRYVSNKGSVTLTLVNAPSNIGYSFVMTIDKLTEDGSVMQTIKSRHLNNVNASTNKTGIWVRTYNPVDGFSNWYEITLK